MVSQAPRVGFEPTTLRLTAGCSTVELPRNNVKFIIIYKRAKVNHNYMFFIKIMKFFRYIYNTFLRLF